MVYYANHLIRKDRQLIPQFPFYKNGCGKCGNCKKHQIDSYKDAFTEIVYIGNGLSDRCAAGCADILFAKDALAAYCRQEGLFFYEFSRIADVVSTLNDLEKNKIKTKQLQEIIDNFN